VDNKDTPPTPSVETTKKRSRGRPKGSKTSPPQRVVAATMTMAEAVRLGIDPRIIVKAHVLITSGVNPVSIMDKQGNVHDVGPDPSPLASAPTLQQKTESWKFLAQYGWGQPAQSTTIDIEFRAKLEAIGTGVPTPELERYNPEVLNYIKKALELASGNSNEDAIDAEFTELTVNKDDATTNSPLSGEDSELLSEDK
jgi:hypothetical protein